jgi:hypothetical protein
VVIYRPGGGIERWEKWKREPLPPLMIARKRRAVMEGRGRDMGGIRGGGRGEADGVPQAEVMAGEQAAQQRRQAASGVHFLSAVNGRENRLGGEEQATALDGTHLSLK